MADAFTRRLAAALYGGAIGDGIGAPVEGLRREQILELVGPINGFVRPTHYAQGAWAFCDRADGKGDGRITDDTLMVEALLVAYTEHGDHLDAYAYRDVLASITATRPVWLPEWQRKAVLLDRLASAEQYLIRGLLNSNRDPRFFGATLHQITCGAAMCAWPIGGLNAGDPRGAYDEAGAFFSAQTYSYGLEQAGVMAAAMAEALAPGATAQSVVAAAVWVARDATREMIRAAVGAIGAGADRETDLPAIRAAVRPWHHKSTHVADTDEHTVGMENVPSNRGIESRLHTSEELPVAIAMVLRADGDFEEATCASAEYGEDADSIAGMAGSLAGALLGLGAIPEAWRDDCDTQNQRDYAQMTESFASVIRSVASRDEERRMRRALTINPSPAEENNIRQAT
ncbi:MAG: ADP-ribosylglycohydrolase family protein [Phycisphaeraceae bacterium]